MKTVLTGIQPSGELHLGNYLGAMQPAVQMQDLGQAIYFIADYHALTTIDSSEKLRKFVFQVAAGFMAAGVDCSRTILFRQSAIPEVHELAWLLSVVTPMGLLERATSYKDKVANGIEPSHGLFAYPILMAADILLYGSDVVPVGRDQKQHLEIARDIASKFNDKFGATFKLPEPIIREQVETVPGLDGRKMSKSYGNTIEIFGEPKQIEKRIMSIPTDSTPMDQPKPVQGTVLDQIMKAVAKPDAYQAFLKMAETPGTGYGHLKKELAKSVMELLGPMQARYKELTENPSIVEKALADGAARARALATPILQRAREVTGLR